LLVLVLLKYSKYRSNVIIIIIIVVVVVVVVVIIIIVVVVMGLEKKKEHILKPETFYFQHTWYVICHGADATFKISLLCI
jgi:flagellar basal body-associated protein FliL